VNYYDWQVKYIDQRVFHSNRN